MQHTSPTTLRDQYETWHAEWAHIEGARSDTLTHPWHLSAAPFVQRYAPNADVLEIGCGRGDFAVWIAKQCRGARVTGIDFSAAAIETARQRTDNGVRFEVADAQALPFGSDSFDLLVSCECMEHVPDPDAMAREMFRVLRPGGHFVLTTENYFNGMTIAWLRSWLTKTPYDSGSGVQPHENYFLFWRVKRILEQAGLVVEAMRSNHFQWLLLPGFDPAALCTESFARPLWNRVFRPFGRHFTFAGQRR